MKRIIVWLCLIAALLSLVGCGAKEKAESKISEAVGEKVLEDVSEGNADVDIQDDQIKIKDKNGNEMVIGGAEWPDSELAKKIPKFMAGKISSAVATDEGFIITVGEVEPADYSEYYTDIKAKFSENTYESNSDGMVTYGGSDADGITVCLYYTQAESSLIINVAKSVK